MAVSIKSFVASHEATDAALDELAAKLEASDCKPSLICLFYDCTHEAESIYQFVRKHFPHVPLLGGTSSGGVMTETGLATDGAIGMLLIEDPDGDYGTASVALEGNIADCAERAFYAALAAANCEGELPELIWIYQEPGREEAVIEGLRRVVGDRCPIIGGSSADNDVAGKWCLIGPEGPLHDGLVVGVMFSSGGIGFAFQGGYEPSGHNGIVTRIGHAPAGDSGAAQPSSSRLIIEIDGEPAAEVYKRWVGGGVLDEKIKGGNILRNTTMFPLGIDSGKIGDVTHYLLIHPEQITDDGALSTFAAVEEGTRVYSMRGNKSRLVDRAGKVITAATSMLPGGASDLAGGIMVYCAGCMMAVDDHMPKVSETVASSFDEKPFIGCFTFGEQGYMLDKNVHGNLMISAVVFGR